jgi:hypothetical protein
MAVQAKSFLVFPEKLLSSLVLSPPSIVVLANFPMVFKPPYRRAFA